MHLLIVMTSHSQLGDSALKTGLWLEEFAAPYYVFLDAGAGMTLASPLGGQPPIDPKSEEAAAQTDATRRLMRDATALEALAHTVRLDSLEPRAFDAVFYPGGHGPLWDLAEDRSSITLIESMLAAGKTVVAVCHAPGVLRHVLAPDGQALVKGKNVTGFSNSEEAAVGLSAVVPFAVQDMLTAAGGKYTQAAADWQPHVVTDGLLITGQNPASSLGAAKALVQRLMRQRAQLEEMASTWASTTPRPAATRAP